MHDEETSADEGFVIVRDEETIRPCEFDVMRRREGPSV